MYGVHTHHCAGMPGIHFIPCLVQLSFAYHARSLQFDLNGIFLCVQVVALSDGPAQEKVRVPRNIIYKPSGHGNQSSPEEDDDDNDAHSQYYQRGNRSMPFYMRPGIGASHGDMYQSSAAGVRQRQIHSSSDPFQRYVAALQCRQLFIKTIEGDGNCMFRSISHQLYGEERFHGIVRQACMDYMESESQYFSHFVVGGGAHFKEYVRFKRMDGVWGDDPEIQAICELYDRPMEVSWLVLFDYALLFGTNRHLTLTLTLTITVTLTLTLTTDFMIRNGTFISCFCVRYGFPTPKMVLRN
jgi:hypothetical protein